jgi:hypothetical protein
MKVVFTRIFWAGFASLALAGPALAQATDLCIRHQGQILGAPLTLEYRWPLDLERPPELLERPQDANALFNDVLAPFDANSNRESSCTGGGITGALNCAFEDVRNMNDAPLTPLEAETEMNARSDVTPVGDDSTTSATEEIETPANAAAQDGRDMERYAYGKVKIVPVFGDDHPPSVRMAVVDTTIETDFNKLTPEAARRIHGDLKQMSDGMKTWRTALDGEDVADLTSGKPFRSLEMEVFISQDTSPQTQLRASGPILLPASCNHLFSMRTQAAEQGVELAKARARLRRLEQRHKAEKDSERKRKLGVQMQIAQNKVNQLAAPLETLEKRIRNEESKQDKAAHEAEIAAIKADPKLTEDARITRLKDASDKLRSLRQHEKQRAAAIQAYQDGLRDYDEKIKNAPDESTRIGYEDAKARYQRLYDGWSEQSRSTLATRYRDLKRIFKDNADDGIGPTDVDSTIAGLQKMGVDPKRQIEDSDKGMMERAARIAKSDQRTLGGETSRANDAFQKFRDTAMAFGEERQKVIMTPLDAINKLKDVADGKTTLKEVWDDQVAFRERYAHYGKGTVKGAVKGVVGLGELGMDGLALEAEREEAQMENALSELFGRRVEIDYFGDRKTKSAANTFAKSGLAMEKFFGESDRRSGLNKNVTLEEAWEDPSKVGEMLEGAANAFSDRTASASGKVGDALAGAADKRLGKIVKGGEKELRLGIEDFGVFIGEGSDAGMAALAALKGIKRGANLIENLDNVGDGVKAAERTTDVASDASRATNANALEKAAEGAKSGTPAPTPSTTPGATAVDNPSTFNDLNVGDSTTPVPFNDAPNPRSAETLPPSETNIRNAETLPPSETNIRNAETLPPSETPSEMGTRSTPASEGTFGMDADLGTRTTPHDGTFNDGANLADGSSGNTFGDGDLGAPTAPHEFSANPGNGTSGSGASVPANKQFKISPQLQAMLDEAPPDISDAQKALSKSSPFVGDRRPTPSELRPIKGTVTTPDGQPAKLAGRNEASGLDLQITRPDGSVENIQVGDRLGGGTTATVYNTRDGKQAVRLAEMTSDGRVPQGSQLDLSRKGRKGFEADHVGRKLLEEAEPKATYFRTAERTSKSGITRIDGKDYFVATEELVTDAKAAFANPLNPDHAWRGAPNADPLDRLTMELAIRDLNAQGIAFTDHKLANLAVVKDPSSPTGRRVVFFDTGGMMPMKGADSAARAGNARQVQHAFDAPKSADPLASPSQRFNAYDNSAFWDRVDKRPFGNTFPAGAATPGGNSKRSAYLKMSEMNAADLRAHIRNDLAMMAQLKDEGRTLDKLVIPGQ